MLILILVVILLVGAVVIFAEMRPTEFEHQRNIVIAAPAAQVFALIEDFRNWPRWQPLDREDSTLRRNYDGPARGKGAVSAFQGKSVSGRQEIIEASPSAMLMVRVDFTRPFETENINTFTLAPAHINGTSLTWTIRGTLPFLAKLMGLIVNIDNAMGKHLEDGLRNLKIESETARLQQPVSG